jgi:CheY-like chemotaxis protein
MKNVMVVDDDPGVLNTIDLVLRRHGYTVVKAPNGHLCLEHLRQGFRGVVLMDIMMPGLTGWETIREIIAANLLDNILVCMLTAKASPGTEGEGLEEFVFDYLPKPFDNVELMSMLDNAIECLEP